MTEMINSIRTVPMCTEHMRSTRCECVRLLWSQRDDAMRPGKVITKGTTLDHLEATSREAEPEVVGKPKEERRSRSRC